MGVEGRNSNENRLERCCVSKIQLYIFSAKDVFEKGKQYCTGYCSTRIRATGRVRQSSYEANGATRYTVDLLADGFAILVKANGKTADDDNQD